MQNEEMEIAISNFLKIENQLFPEKTFFEIAGFPSRENVFSNILKFYLDTREKHGLGALVIKALLQEVKPDVTDADLTTIQIRREVTTTKYNRIDLVIDTNKYLIGIENKVYHSLQNDLADYADYLEKQSSKEKIFIVLNLYDDKSIHEQGFKAVSYMGFVDRLESSILNLTDNKYTILLKEFIQNIKNHFPQHMTKEQIDFYLKNVDSIRQIAALEAKVIPYLGSRLNSIYNLVNIPYGWKTIREVPATFEIYAETGKEKYLKLLCTLEINNIYFEACAEEPRMLRLKQFFETKYAATDLQILYGLIYIPHPNCLPIYNVNDQDIADAFNALIEVTKEFIEQQSLVTTQ